MRRRFTVSLLVAGLLSVAAPGAWAQVNEIPKEIIRAQTIAPNQESTIREFVVLRLGKLADADPMVIKRSRDELLAPFKDGQVSVAFRQAYDVIATPELKRLVGDPNDVIVVNGLRIAAEMATSNGTAILESKLGDKLPAVRFAAVNGMERTMTALARGPAIPPQRVEQVVDLLGKVIVDPTSTPEVVDAAVRALWAGRNVAIGSVKSRSFHEMTTSVGKVAQRIGGQPTPEATQQMFLRAAGFARDGIGNAQLGLGGDSARDATWMTGQLLSWSFCQFKAGNMAQKADRGVAADVVKVAETTMVLAGQKAGVAIAPQQLGTDFEKADGANDQNFVRNLPKLMQPIFAAPLNFNQGEFLNCRGPGGGG